MVESTLGITFFHTPCELFYYFYLLHLLHFMILQSFRILANPASLGKELEKILTGFHLLAGAGSGGAGAGG